jgi:phage terminase large subunit GpA-like protein
VARRESKPVKLGEWQIIKIGKVARYIGNVQATDAEAAIQRAIEKFDIEPEHRDRIAARQIVVR